MTTLFDDGENPAVPARVLLPGGKRVADCSLTVDALGPNGVVVTAVVRGDELLKLFVDQASTFIQLVGQALEGMCQYAPPECRLLPRLVRRDEELLPAKVMMPGSVDLVAGRLDLEARGMDRLSLELRFGDTGLAFIDVEEAKNFFDLLEHASENYEPDEGGE